jgi:signal transduction histidine kinase
MHTQSSQSRFDKKRTVLLLRSVVIISISYLIVFGQAPTAPASLVYILALILTNVGLTLTPRAQFHQPWFSAALLLGDTAMVLVGLYLTVGCFSQDFLIIYFFTIFLTTATSNLAQIAAGAALVSGLYGYWLWLTAAHTLGPGEWLRLPFFFIVAVFYAFMTEEARTERLCRVRAERESDRLRFLFDLSNTVPQCVATEELIAHMGELIAAAFPRLHCGLGADGAMNDRQSNVFALQSNGRSFGTLRVTTKDGLALRPNEDAFCHLAAAIAANALYTAEQVSAADNGLRIKEEFLATLSHELRSPLHVILGNAEIVSEMLLSTADPLVRDSLERLRANACRLLDLIEEMLCFAELRAGKSPVQRQAVDLHALFEECAAVMVERLAGRPIVFRWHVADDVPVLQTDAGKLRLIVNGLLSNAAKFTEQGLVHLQAERLGSYVDIAVRDSGIGIASKDLTHIFQAFRQLDGSLTRRFHGLGIGLALAQELTTALGGVVDVESEPNRGSTFHVHLPFGPVAEAAIAAQPVTMARLRYDPAS